MVRRYSHLLRVMNPVRLGNVVTNLTLVADCMIEDRKERFTFRTIFPVRLAATHVPHLSRLGEVEVLLGVVGTVVAGRTQVLRIHLEPFGQTRVAAHMLGPGAGRIEPTDECRAGGRAHGRGGPTVEVHHPLGRQSIEVGRLGILITVTAKFRTVILRSNPENVRQFLLCRHVERNKQAQEE